MSDWRDKEWDEPGEDFGKSYWDIQEERAEAYRKARQPERRYYPSRGKWR